MMSSDPTMPAATAALAETQALLLSLTEHVHTLTDHVRALTVANAALVAALDGQVDTDRIRSAVLDTFAAEGEGPDSAVVNIVNALLAHDVSPPAQPGAVRSTTADLSRLARSHLRLVEKDTLE